MNRPFLIAFIGVLAVALAIALNYVPWPSDEPAPPPAAVTSAPATEPAAPETPKPRVKAEPAPTKKAEPPAETSGASKPETPEPAQEPQKAEPLQPDPPTFDVVRVNADGHAVIAGRAVPESTVVNYDNGVEFGRVKADDRGEWVFVPDSPLAPGTHTLRLKMVMGELPPVNSVEDVIIVVAERAKDTPAAVAATPAPAPAPAPASTPASTAATPAPAPAPSGTDGGGALAVKITPDGASTVMQKPGPESTVKLSVDAIDYDDRGRLSISGSAEPESKVQLYLDNGFVGQAQAGSDTGEGRGGWSMSPETAVDPGLYTLRADQIDDGGKVVQRVELPFSRAERTPELATKLAARENTVIVQPGNSLWRIARSNYGEGIRFTVIYQANADQISDPDLIYPGQVFKLPENE